MDQPRIVAIIPTYNNQRTIAGVVSAVREHIADILVVNDGSTDGTAGAIAGVHPAHVITFERNRGKGHALAAAFAYASEHGYTHAITIDADGQHLPQDLPAFVDAVGREPQTLWIGNRVLPMLDGVPQPPRSRFGARFGTFWYRFHTGLRIDDTQCGLRAYPLHRICNIHVKPGRYEYEIEILINAAWARIPVKQIPIRLFYQPRSERVSHFRPLRDFARISVVNSKAALIRIFVPWRFVDAPGATGYEKLRYLLVKELSAHHSPRRAAAALSIGAFLGITPFHGFQVMMVMALSVMCKLNRPLALLGVAISSPPLLPFWIAAGYWAGTLVLPTEVVRTWALWASHAGLERLAMWLNPAEGASKLGIGFLQWAAGSMVLAVAVGILVFAVSYPIFLRMQTLRERKAAKARDTDQP